MRAIDTNVLVRLVTRDDPKQTETAERFVEHGAWVSLLALAESTWVLSSVYDLPRKDIANVVEMLLDHKQLVLQDRETVSSALEQFRAKPSIGFSGCLILQIALKAGHVPLGTFDRDLAKAEGAERL